MIFLLEKSLLYPNSRLEVPNSVQNYFDHYRTVKSQKNTDVATGYHDESNTVYVLTLSNESHQIISNCAELQTRFFKG